MRPAVKMTEGKGTEQVKGQIPNNTPGGRREKKECGENKDETEIGTLENLTLVPVTERISCFW